MLKRLISLNLAFIFMLSLLPVWAVPIHAVNSHDKLIVDGMEYDATECIRSDSFDWYPAEGDETDHLHIHANYLGGTVITPQDADIQIDASFYGDDSEPAIVVNGNAVLSYVEDVTITGGNGKPAIETVGSLQICTNTNSDTENTFLLSGGGDNISAIISGDTISIDQFFSVGATENDLSFAKTYNGEHLVKIQNHIDIADQTLVPEGVDKGELIKFLAWRQASTESKIWYLPGDSVSEMLGTKIYPFYLTPNFDPIGIILDGNGGKTEDGSNYFVTMVSSNKLHLYELPEAVKKDGYTLLQYNTEKDGTGISYLPGESITDTSRIIHHLYAIWEKEPFTHEKSFIIDGIEYDATQDQRGKTWRYYSYSEDGDDAVGELNLINYTGGPIYCNQDIQIHWQGTNVISGDDRHGIYVMGNLYLNSGVYKSEVSSLTVSGAENFEAIYATETITVESTALTASGGGVSALNGKEISFRAFWPFKAIVGESQERYTERNYLDYKNGQSFYNGENYVHLERLPYSMTLHANGGSTTSGEDFERIVFVTGTPGYLHLYYRASDFSNGNKQLLGWTEDSDGTGKYYAIDEEYKYPEGEYTSELYALWEDDTNKAVILNNYYGSYGSTGSHKGVSLPFRVAKGDVFVLPDQTKPGCTFDGWIADNDETVYPAGSVITVEDTISFTAQFVEKTLVINGKEYDASENCGSYALGWHYFASSQLNIYNNYSGKPISIPESIEINLFKSMTGDWDQPPITVDGDCEIHVYNWEGRTDCPVVLTGCSNSPAIKASGEIRIAVSGDDMKFVVASGGEDIPAIQGAKVINTHRVFWTGSDANNVSLVAKYSGEEYAEFTDTWQYTVELQGNSVVPSVPAHELYSFVGWFEVADSYGVPELRKWFMPGDKVNAGDGMKLEAVYVDNNRTTTAIIIDGQGQKTTAGSNYFVKLVSSSNLYLYQLPDSPFVCEDSDLAEYNTTPTGTGTSYHPGDTLTTDELIWELYSQWDPVYQVSLEEGVSLKLSPNSSSVQVLISTDWCIEHGVTQAIAALYDEKRMLNCALEQFDGSTGLSLSMTYSENNPPNIKLFALDEKLSPVYLVLSCELRESIK